MNRDRHENIPTERLRLYEALYEMLLLRRDKERRIAVEADYPALPDSKKLRLLEDLAYWMMRNNLAIAAENSVHEHVQGKLSDMELAHYDADIVCRLLVDRSVLRGDVREQLIAVAGRRAG